MYFMYLYKPVGYYMSVILYVTYIHSEQSSSLLQNIWKKFHLSQRAAKNVLQYLGLHDS